MPPAPYELIYYAGVPGRGEHIRLLLEHTLTPYTDTASLPLEPCHAIVAATLSNPTPSPPNPPYFAPPLLRHSDLLISQTSNILMYLGYRLGLAGETEDDAWRVNALDGLSNKVHDCHHPIAVELFWEEQKGRCLDGTWHSFPRAMEQAKMLGRYERVFRLYEDVKKGENVAGYLASQKRQEYDWGFIGIILRMMCLWIRSAGMK
ncbi:hypothetical protein BU23DRAFT_652446 [Bimuria novae-zelandiae CBS 107.79]|uniref:GST N-terminal domain-containing protein n=1 Tax=Bimuria novae-zelandiae CBS 107.79 TaxID=1447943 RepID=A0A6A5V0X3_9PLEO|nr:hypothetical protein BU23DRAFT_652446 [Bimuria novae-zelandiae CBS 107.79]